MCTIGIVYRKSTMIIFEQCDLDKETLFYEPKIKNNKDIKYMSFEREGIQGSWCGVNNYGVSFVAADSFVKGEDNYLHNSASKVEDSSIFKAYESIISNFKSAKEAVEFMKNFYATFYNPDILIISDRKESYYIESYHGEVVEALLAPEFHPQYFVSTNHFRFIHGGVSFEENHSTYLRLKRAEEMLLEDCSINGVKKLLKNQYYGKSVMSICRSSNICPKGEAAYNTQAAVMFVVNNNCNDISTYYEINGNPKDNKLIFKDRVFCNI